MLSLIVGVDGKAHVIKAVTPLGKGLGEKAINAVNTWKFEPGKKDGVPVATLIEVTVEFHLKRSLAKKSLVEGRAQEKTRFCGV